MEMVLESLWVLDKVLDLEQRLVELKLEVLLLMFRGEGYIMQGFKQFNVEPLKRGSERSLLTNTLDWDFVEEEVGEVVEITEDCLENCPWHAKAATSKAEAVDLSDVLAEVST